MGTRHYDPITGRFLSPDPFGHAGSLDLYSYANNDPVNYVDPDGRFGKGAHSGMKGGGVDPSQSLAHNIGVVAGRVPYEVGSTINHPAVDYYPVLGPLKQLTQSVTGSDFMGRPLTGAQRTGSAVAAGLGALPVGVIAKAGAAAGKAAVHSLHGAARAESSLSAQLLRQDLLRQEAASAFTATGELSPGALASSFKIMGAAELKNQNIPAGFSKWSTDTFQSPSGNFQVHFYRNSVTGEVHYGLDYKAKFNTLPKPLWPGPK